MPARKKKTPAPIATTLKRSTTTLIGHPRIGVRILRRRDAVDESGGSESGEQRKPKRDILDPARARGGGDQKERTNSPGADELRRHHAIGVARAAQDAHEPDGDREQDHARSREKKLSQRRSPG